jgi:acyl-coenzyme A synthetase/AMP-(fatty) acid ligase
VVAWVVPVAGGSPPLLADLREHVGAQLGRWAAPRELELVSSLPRTATGKIRRSELA